jgi:hypothetical protein
LRRIKVGDGPWGIAVFPKGKMVWAAVHYTQLKAGQPSALARLPASVIGISFAQLTRQPVCFLGVAGLPI